MNTTKPHQAIFEIKIKVHEVLPDGSLNPTIMTDEQLKEFGLSSRATLSVKGFNLKNCLENLEKKLEKLNDNNWGC